MFNLRDEIAWWKTVSSALNKFHIAKNANVRKKLKFPFESCPFCFKADIRMKTMNTLGTSEDPLKIGLFTCKSCNQSWSEPIQ